MMKLGQPDDQLRVCVNGDNVDPGGVWVHGPVPLQEPEQVVQ